MGQQRINTLSSTPSLAARLLFVAWSFAELSDSISRGVNWWRKICGSVVHFWALCLAGMYKGEASRGICATAAVADLLELDCYSSDPFSEICVLEDQQSFFWPKKGIDSSEMGTLLIQPQEHVRVSTWPDWVKCCSRYSDFLEEFPITELVSSWAWFWAWSSCCEGWSLGNISVWLPWNILYKQTTIAGRTGCQ